MIAQSEPPCAILRCRTGDYADRRLSGYAPSRLAYSVAPVSLLRPRSVYQDRAGQAITDPSSIIRACLVQRLLRPNDSFRQVKLYGVPLRSPSSFPVASLGK